MLLYIISYLEILRKYPLASVIIRKSSSNYTFKNTKLTIPKNKKILILTYAIHHDPKIYPKPEVYGPERFSDEAVES
jgi:cytochrome P450 family 6